MKKNLSFLMLFMFIMSGVAIAQNGWVNLFNGENLEGWKQLNGEAKYEVVDGVIVGTTVLNTPNSFLCTEKNYSDFIFEVELWVEPNMNSGIQFRSLSNPEYNNGRVHGYQCEVDPSDRAWSAGIYDEARRGWLYPLELNPQAKSALKMGKWNKYRIECIGSSIRTWLNDIPVAHLIDDMTSEGFIALQVHGIGNNKDKEGQQIKWRNIRIKTEDLEPAFYADIHVENLIPNNLNIVEKKQGFKLLFDGVSTDNWKNAETGKFPESGWEVKDGVLSVLSKTEEPNRGGSIITKEEFGPFELKFEFKLTEGANSGIKYGIGNNGPGLGLEYQILDDEKHPDAKNGVVGNRTLASLYDLIPADKERRFLKKIGEWNRGRIVVYPCGTVQHWLNGRKVVEYERGNNIYKALVARSKYVQHEGFGLAEKGPVLLQDHSDHVSFRSIKIREY
uniref:3-keto-disaccharide hydrolase n=1 Tax=uncultured Draconibacterium sp. TaxID=1573823 RepID=UPI00321808B1